MIYLLTFDVEDWFHVLDHEATRNEEQWNRYPSRLKPGVEKILSLLDKHSVKATFFCLGWIARKYPEVIREIVRHGHSIGCHSDMHQLVYEQTETEFKNDLDRAIKSIEDIIGEKVRCYRAPGFSITDGTPWAFETLLHAGIEIDSSVFPARRAHGGYTSFPSGTPALITMKGMILKEFPVNIRSVFTRPLVFSGGGYFRLFPYPLIKKFSLETSYIMTYFHPRDFDPDQPVIPGLTMKRRFKSYYGIKGSLKKLDRWLSDFSFSDIDSANLLLNWDRVPQIEIGRSIKI